MKNLIVRGFVLLIACASATASQAKIWRLNNNGNNPNPAIQADFTGTLQQAHDNAGVVSGDTIHVEQSPTPYGACVFTKRLVVIGPGYFLDKNPQTQVNVSYEAVVGQLTMANAACAGTQIWGLYINAATYMQTNNLLLGRCYQAGHLYVGSGNATNITGLVIRQNYMTPSTGSTGAIQQLGGTGLCSNMEITNNIITLSTGPVTYGAVLDGRFSGIFKNNVTYSYIAFSIANFYIVNNMSYVVGTSTLNNCVVEYNMGTAASAYTAVNGSNNTYGPGNQVKTFAQMLFTGGASVDNYWQLQAGSPAKTAGKDGVDLGVFSGDYPYKLSGIAPVPNIYALTIAPISAGASSISVTVSAKGNN